jgi:hypothetical protein
MLAICFLRMFRTGMPFMEQARENSGDKSPA